MKHFKTLLILLLLMAGSCTPASRFIVTQIAYEPLEYNENVIYVLPETNLKVGISYEKQVFIPGPYCDYSLKMLGIEGVGRSRTEAWRVSGTNISTITEADFAHYYSLNLIEGELDQDMLVELEKDGYLMTSLQFEHTLLRKYDGEIRTKNALLFKDVTMEPNVELKRETMYKTILTDTSFVRVPVVSEQLERKTLEKKAEEAAKLILDIRNDRYYLSAGLLDPFPQDFDLATALETLDRLEEEYLSLFIGISYTVPFYREYLLYPTGSEDSERFLLDSFSEREGFSGSAAEEGRLSLEITPEGSSSSLRNLLPQVPEEEVYNRIYYRIPEMTDVRIFHGASEIHHERIPVFQYGAVVNVKK